MNPILNTWKIQLLGDILDLQFLQQHFNEFNIRVLKGCQDNEYFYESDSFKSSLTPNEVLKNAENELLILTGILRLEGRGLRALQAGAVFKATPSGQTEIFLNIVETAHVRAECSVSLQTSDPEGHITQSVIQNIPRSLRLVNLAESTPAIAKALRLIGAKGAKSWVELYRILEVIIDDVGGSKQLELTGLCSAKDLARFKHSANSVAVAGDAARHGNEDTQPPRRPMSIEEAQAYINYVLESWIASKQ